MGNRNSGGQEMPDILSLPQERKLRKLYYEGATLPSPMGGILEPLHVQFGGAGAGKVTFECLSSSLRYGLSIPRATKAERDAVRKEVDAGLEPTCPRHGGIERLARMGKVFACRRCGISFGQAG